MCVITQMATKRTVTFAVGELPVDAVYARTGPGRAVRPPPVPVRTTPEIPKDKLQRFWDLMHNYIRITRLVRQSLKMGIRPGTDQLRTQEHYRRVIFDKSLEIAANFCNGKDEIRKVWSKLNANYMPFPLSNIAL